MDGTHPKLWLTIQEAAEYLRCSDDSVERRLVESEDFSPLTFRPGFLRFCRIEHWNAVTGSERATPIRVLGEDVYELLPLPESVQLNVQRSTFNVQCSRPDQEIQLR